MTAKPQDHDLILEAMLQYWGKPCRVKDPECPCCHAWEQFDWQENELTRLRSLVVANVDAYAERLTTLNNQRKLERLYVQRQAQKACRYLDMGWHALAREFIRPLMTGDYRVQDTTDATTRHASTVPYGWEQVDSD